MADPVNESIALSWTPEFAAYAPSKEHKAWAIATLKAPLFEPTARAPVDICAVIDRSGSMHGEKLDLVKETLEFVIDQLKECDRLSLVTYDTNVKVQFGLTKMDAEQKEKTKAAVKALQSGSSTNLSGGLIEGMTTIANRGGDKAKVSSVLLLTDGLANVGVTKCDMILDEMRKILDPKPGSPPFDGTVYTFGFGSDHDAKMLEAISTTGGGVYYYIDSTEKIPESFADCLGGLLSVVGQNLTLTFEASGNNTITGVHTARPRTWKTPNKKCEVAMGDLQSEEGRDVLLEIQAPVVPAPCSEPVVTATLSYFNVITSSLDNVAVVLTLERTDAEPGPPNSKLDMQRNRIMASNALKEARQLAEQSKFSEATAALTAMSARVAGSVSAQEEYCQGLLSDMKSSVDAMSSQQRYKSHGAHYMMSKMQTHAVQRSNYVSEGSSYQSAAKSGLVMKAKKKK